MSQRRNNLRQLASRLVAVQEQARSLGIFANDRELLECRKCGLLEDVTFTGHRITCRPQSLGHDTGVRFQDFRRTISAVLRAARRFIFRLRAESLEDSDNLPDPDILAQEIVVPRLASLGTTPSQDSRPARGPRRGVEDLEAALEQFREITTDLGMVRN